MNNFTLIWEFIDGKKTNIGGAFVLLATVLEFFGVVKELTEPIKAFGEAVMVFGFGHKVLKMRPQ